MNVVVDEAVPLELGDLRYSWVYLLSRSFEKGSVGRLSKVSRSCIPWKVADMFERECEGGVYDTSLTELFYIFKRRLL